MTKKDVESSAKIYYRLGVISLQRRDEKGALINLNLCIQTSIDDEITLKCEEGITDVKIMMNDSEAALVVGAILDYA